MHFRFPSWASNFQEHRLVYEMSGGAEVSSGPDVTVDAPAPAPEAGKQMEVKITPEKRNTTGLQKLTGDRMNGSGNRLDEAKKATVDQPINGKNFDPKTTTLAQNFEKLKVPQSPKELYESKGQVLFNFQRDAKFGPQVKNENAANLPQDIWAKDNRVRGLKADLQAKEMFLDEIQTYLRNDKGEDPTGTRDMWEQRLPIMQQEIQEMRTRLGKAEEELAKEKQQFENPGEGSSDTTEEGRIREQILAQGAEAVLKPFQDAKHEAHMKLHGGDPQHPEDPGLFKKIWDLQQVNLQDPQIETLKKELDVQDKKFKENEAKIQLVNKVRKGRFAQLGKAQPAENPNVAPANPQQQNEKPLVARGIRLEGAPVDNKPNNEPKAAAEKPAAKQEGKEQIMDLDGLAKAVANDPAGRDITIKLYGQLVQGGMQNVNMNDLMSGDKTTQDIATKLEIKPADLNALRPKNMEETRNFIDKVFGKIPDNVPGKKALMDKAVKEMKQMPGKGQNFQNAAKPKEQKEQNEVTLAMLAKAVAGDKDGQAIVLKMMKQLTQGDLVKKDLAEGDRITRKIGHEKLKMTDEQLAALEPQTLKETEDFIRSIDKLIPNAIKDKQAPKEA